MDDTEDTHLDQHLSTTASSTLTLTHATATAPDATIATSSASAQQAQTDSDSHQHQSHRTSSATRSDDSAHTLRRTRSSKNLSAAATSSESDNAPPLRRSARISVSGPPSDDTSGNTGGNKKQKQEIPESSSGTKRKRALPSLPPLTLSPPPADRKGKKKQESPPSSPLTDIDAIDEAPAKRTRRSNRNKPEEPVASSSSASASAKGKGKGKAVAKPRTSKTRMPKKTTTPKTRRGGQAGSSTARPQKGDHTPKQLVDDDMDEDDRWTSEAGPSRSRLMDDMTNDEDMDRSDDDEDHSDDDDEDQEDAGAGAESGRLSAFERFSQLASQSGMHLDEATAAALFGGEFRGFGGLMSGITSRFKRLRTDLRSKKISTRLAALRECSEVLLVSNEDTLGGAFSPSNFATEFIAILNGKPNIDADSRAPAEEEEDDGMDEDAMLARALAMSTEDGMPPGMAMENEEEMECQLVACRCLAHLMEALPGTGHTLVHLGAVPVLCSKLNEPSYIELAEQTLSTMEKLSAEYPSAIVREGGLEALLRFLDFFSTNVQRTAVSAAANCCKNISSEYFTQVKAIFPTLRSVLVQTDQRLVESATLAVVRVLESYRSNAQHLEGLLDLETVVAINALLVPSGGSPLISPATYTHLLRALTSSARGSAKVTIAFLEAGMTSTVYQILTGVLPPTHDEDEQGMSPGGQGLAGGVADMAVLQNLAHRPKDQVEEALALICELLPPTTKEGVFDSKAYSEKALGKLLKGRKSSERERERERPAAAPRRSSRNAAATESTEAAPPAPATAATPEERAAAHRDQTIQALIKQKRDAEALAEKRLESLSEQYKLFERFIRAIVPVLVDVYAASVAARVRTKVLTGLVRAMAFAKPDEMRRTLQAVPMASFLGTIISSKDNHSYVLSALQLVELLSDRLPDIYKANFVREGVVFEIEALSKIELTTVKAAREKEEAETAAKVKQEPEDDAPQPGPSSAVATPTRTPAMPIMPGSFYSPTSSMAAVDTKPLIGADGTATSLSRFLADPSSAVPSAGATSLLTKRYTILDPQDANILRARVMLAKKLFDLEGDDQNAATAVLDKLADQVKVLCRSQTPVDDLRDTLRDVAMQFTDTEHSLSSFELLQSGLIDGLLEFVDVDGVVPAAERRIMLFETFSISLTAASSPLAMLVKRLHESLGRLETFEVETAFNGVADSSRSASSLGRTMRIRLQPEEGADSTRASHAISVTIQAIATIQALNDYLRNRVGTDGNLSNGMAGLFGAYGGMAIPRGGGGSASSLLSALSAAGAFRGGQTFGSSAPEPRRGGGIGGGPGASGGAGAASATTSQAVAGGSSAAPTGDAAEGSEDKPQRRRSARISAAAQGEDSTGAAGEGAAQPRADPSTPAAASTSAPSALPLSSSAPEAGGIFGGMPLDMDFDDEYSDEDYDAEVFEDEMAMEHQLSRPQEKIVNMSVAPDGSKVEVKTPDGTRVATPSQNPAAAAAPSSVGPSAAPSGGGAATPRTASYAGAVKTAPSDWHLEFSLNGKALSLNDTIYGAVHRSQSQQSGASSGGAGVFGGSVVFKFKKVEGPAPTSDTADAPSPDATGGMPLAFDAGLPTTKILRLLRLVHGLSVEARDAAPGHHDEALEESMFVNNKLTAKLTRQLEETMIIASNCLPPWATELPKHFPFLFPFEARYSFLQNNSFGYSRLIARYQAAQQARSSSSSRRDDLAHLSRIVRQKVRISRAQLLESAAKVLELYGTGSAILEVEYFDEIGTGLGPTLEFYSLASREFARKALGIWRNEDETREGDYVHHPRGLFPAPIAGGTGDSSTGTHVGWFKTLGLFVGRALLDSRIIDVNLNKVFLKLILGLSVRKSIATLRQVDPALARSLERLQAYSHARKEIEALRLPGNARQEKLLALTVNGAVLRDLSLDFTLPGYEIELKPGGAQIDVDDGNLDEYLELVLDKTLGSGIEAQVEAFKEGFSMIYSIKDMRIFSTEELGLLFGNSDEDWSKETIEHAIKADHGYNLDSRSVRSLIDVMSSYTKEERRQFLQFITGAPKLPIGGFRGLNPQFTVVRKPHEAPFRADDYLPSVMTCAQYLKLPDYSTRDILAQQLQRAMLDGGGSFHLS